MYRYIAKHVLLCELLKYSCKKSKKSLRNSALQIVYGKVKLEEEEKKRTQTIGT